MTSPGKVGILIVATRRYVRFVDPLVASLRRHFLSGHERTVFIFTDRNIPRRDVRVLRIRHEPWPQVTLHRYRHLTEHRDALAGMDHLFLMDADMRVVAPVGDEILPDGPHGLVGVIHPGFHEDGARGTYETNPGSTASVGPDEAEHYFAGGFLGGTTEAFLAMATQLAANIDADARAGLVAVWHDESHVNRYFADHPPKPLSPSYCYPESWRLPFEPRILALQKDHGAMRAEGLARLGGGLKRAIRSALRRLRPRGG